MSFITKCGRPSTLRILSQANRMSYGTNCRPIIRSSEKPDTFKQVIDHSSKESDSVKNQIEKREQKGGSSANKNKDENDKSNGGNATRLPYLGLGRFYRQIYASAPDIERRSEIFRVHLKPIQTNLDLQDLSRKMAAWTPGFIEADIANVCEEATLIALRENGESVTLKNFEQAIERVIGPIRNKKYIMKLPERETLAYREASHAVAGWFLEHANPPSKVSINTYRMGYTLPPRTKEECLDRLCMTLARRASDEIFLKKIIEEWETEIMVTIRAYRQDFVEFGMSDKLINLQKADPTMFDRPYSESTAKLIDSESKKIVESAYKRVLELLTSHKKDIEVVAKGLLARESLNQEDMIKLLGKRPFKDSIKEFYAGTSAEEK